MPSVGICLDGKGGVLGVRIRLALKGGQKVLYGDFVFRDNCWHSIFSQTPFKAYVHRLTHAVMQITNGGPNLNHAPTSRFEHPSPRVAAARMFRMETIQYNLPQSRIPQAWYNILADLPKPMAPTLHPGTLKPIGPDDLAPLFPMSLILQEVSTEREIEIPAEVRQIYAQWRPSPLIRARRLEKALDTPAHIYYKYEGVSPAGSHKLNTAVAQAYYNKKDGTKHLSTETGAGQWGSALSMACAFFGLDCKVYMVRVSYDQKPYRRALIEAFGASVVASPSIETESGRAILAAHPDSNGSLGIAISEAVEVAAKDPNTKYALGSVLNHVLLHQTVIGLETIEQMALAGDEPDVIIGCTGGGSNFAGLVMPYLGRKLKGQCHARVIAVEPAACPSLTKGRFTYDFGDTSHLTPLVKMHTLGSTFIPPGIHAGGLRYHGMAPLVSHVIDLGLAEATTVQQLDAFASGIQFARSEGIIPAPEANHAVAVAIRQALEAKEEGKQRTILFNLSGHGHFDMQSYIDYQAGKLQNYEYPEEEIAMALAGLPTVV
jgi:tryptophan synthase beta chain